MHIAPLAHPQRRKKLCVQHLVKFAMRLFVLRRFLIEFPKFYEAQKLRLRMDEFFVGECGFLLLVVWPIARILHRQCRSNDEHFFQRAFTFGRDQHAGDGRINRKFGELPAERSESLVIVDGT